MLWLRLLHKTICYFLKDLKDHWFLTVKQPYSRVSLSNSWEQFYIGKLSSLSHSWGPMAFFPDKEVTIEENVLNHQLEIESQDVTYGSRWSELLNNSLKTFPLYVHESVPSNLWPWAYGTQCEGLAQSGMFYEVFIELAQYSYLIIQPHMLFKLFFRFINVFSMCVCVPQCM